MLSAVTAVLSLALISSARAETYGGDATGAQVTVPASGTLSLSGGGDEAFLLVGDIRSRATAGVVALSAGANLAAGTFPAASVSPT